MAKSPVEIVENSPAYYQSIRNKKRIEVLEQFNNQGMILLRKESKWNHPKTPKPQGFYLYIGVHLMRRSGRSSPLTTRVVSSRLFLAVGKTQRRRQCGGGGRGIYLDEKGCWFFTCVSGDLGWFSEMELGMIRPLLP